MVSKEKDSVKGFVKSEHHVVWMTTLSSDQRNVLRHRKRVYIGGISVAVFYYNGVCSGGMGRLTY